MERKHQEVQPDPDLAVLAVEITVVLHAKAVVKALVADNVVVVPDAPDAPVKRTQYLAVAMTVYFNVVATVHSVVPDVLIGVHLDVVEVALKHVPDVVADAPVRVLARATHIVQVDVPVHAQVVALPDAKINVKPDVLEHVQMVALLDVVLQTVRLSKLMLAELGSA